MEIQNELHLDNMSPKVYTIRDKIIMKNSEMYLIRNRIDELPFGSAFVVSDFTDISDYENAKKCLLRLEKEKFIRRVIRGIYDKPHYSQLINEYSAPNIEEITKAIARNYNWKISPSGFTALNLLGLSTQVPNSYEYFSTGQYKSYQIGNITIRFMHKSSKELLNLSYKSLLVVDAIKELGQSIDDNSISTIKNYLKQEEKECLFKEAGGVTKWIFEIVKKICIKENN